VRGGRWKGWSQRRRYRTRDPVCQSEDGVCDFEVWVIGWWIFDERVVRMQFSAKGTTISLFLVIGGFPRIGLRRSRGKF